MKYEHLSDAAKQILTKRNLGRLKRKFSTVVTPDAYHFSFNRGINILKCKPTACGVDLEWLCQPAEFYLGAGYAVMPLLNDVFRLELSMRFPAVVVVLGKYRMYKGMCMSLSPTDGGVTSMHVGINFHVPSPPRHDVVNHIRVCDRLGILNTTTSYESMTNATLLGGDDMYAMLKGALTGNYAPEFVDRLAYALHRQNNPVGTTAESLVDLLFDYHDTQLRVDKYHESTAKPPTGLTYW